MSFRYVARLLGAPGYPSKRRNPDAPAPVADFRTKAQKASDALLTGTWWRCPTHGLLEDALILAGAAFCTDCDCNLRVLIVAWGRAEYAVETTQATWGTSPHTKANGTLRPAHESSSSRVCHCCVCRALIPMMQRHVIADGKRTRRDAWCRACAAVSPRDDVRAAEAAITRIEANP